MQLRYTKMGARTNDLDAAKTVLLLDNQVQEASSGIFRTFRRRHSTGAPRPAPLAHHHHHPAFFATLFQAVVPQEQQQRHIDLLL